jgi:hypothetical protein
MSFSEQVDHDEIAANRAEVEREGRDEFMDEMERHLTELIRAAREVPSGSTYDQVAAIARDVESRRLNVGELAMLLGLALLGLGQPAQARPVVQRLARHLYDQAHPSNPDSTRRGYIERRWNDDPQIRAKYESRAEEILLVAFSV